MAKLTVECIEAWILEELFSHPSWMEVVGVDGTVLMCVEGPNKGMFVGNCHEVELDCPIQLTMLGDE